MLVVFFQAVPYGQKSNETTEELLRSRFILGVTQIREDQGFSREMGVPARTQADQPERRGEQPVPPADTLLVRRLQIG